LFCPVNVTGLKLYDQDLSTTEPGERTLKEKEKEKEKRKKEKRKKKKEKKRDSRRQSILDRKQF